MSMSLVDAIPVIKSSITSPCTISQVTSCGERSLRVTFEYYLVKILDYSDNYFDVAVYDCGKDYCADFASERRNIPKARIGEYISKF